jgi:predicted ester cyclase
MSLEDNKAIARRHFEELWTKGDLAVADEIYSPDAVGHCGNLPDQTNYPECEKDLVRQDRVAFPDGTATVDDQIAEGDKVLTRWRFRATHTGPALRQPGVGPRHLRQRLPRPPHRRRQDHRDLGARRLLQPPATNGPAPHRGRRSGVGRTGGR